MTSPCEKYNMGREQIIIARLSKVCAAKTETLNFHGIGCLFERIFNSRRIILLRAVNDQVHTVSQGCSKNI